MHFEKWKTKLVKSFDEGLILNFAETWGTKNIFNLSKICKKCNDENALMRCVKGKKQIRFLLWTRKEWKIMA